MNQIDFGGAVIPAMAGFFLFGKKAKVQEIQQTKVENFPALVRPEDKGLTGVARYLIAAPVTTSVAKYLKKTEKQQLSGVAKYVLRQDIAEKNAPRPSGVAQYLNKTAKQPSPVKKSTVARYIANQERAIANQPQLTGVARYEQQQNLIERKKAAAELVEKYREAEQESARLAKEKAIENSYEAAKAMVNAEISSSDNESAPVTRVGRYLLQNADSRNAKPTGVARYLAKQIIIESQKPKLSKVEKYLKDQSLHQNKKAPQTGVAKYLSKLNSIVKPKQVKSAPVIESGVSRYLAQVTEAEAKKPVASGVCKYLERQAKIALENSNKPKAIEYSSAYEISDVEVCLEGEFIPAGENLTVSTGVSKYLERQNTQLSENIEITPVVLKRETGVARYLDRQAVTPELISEPSPLTGVDRYMLRKAS